MKEVQFDTHRGQLKMICKERWLVRIRARLECSEEKGRQHLSKLLGLFNALQNGYVALSYNLKVGKPHLVSATLVYYEEWFGKPFRWEDQNGTIPYWDREAEHWNTFEVENILDWRVIF